MRIWPKAVASAALTLFTLAACSDETPSGISTDSAVPGAYSAPVEPVNGEFIRQTGTNTVFLVYNSALYGIPDMQTLRACTGGYEQIVRSVASLPAWTQRALPSAGNPLARPHGRAWMHGDKPVKNSAGTIYLVVGCVRAGIPSPSVYQSIFGDLDFSRAIAVPDADLNALPEGPQAVGNPLRRAGSLLEWGGVVRWVTFHGGASGIPSESTIASYCRPWSDLVTNGGEFAFHAEQWVLQAATASCLRGNDYPYAGSSMSGVDPWNFYNRQCTSFSAWRLNQEGTEFHNYFRGPHWGNAHNWDNAARSAGLTVNGTAKRGAVAQWEGGAYGASSAGHVAFVAAVHNDGTITVEEYNWSTVGGYGTRRISAAAVSNYIHVR